MPTEKLTFLNASGETLSARLDLPDGPLLATALFAHCFTCGKDIAAARRIASKLSMLGIAVLRFDFTGLGASEGTFASTTFASNTADLIAAATMLTERGMAPSLLIGHSLGGAAVLNAAEAMPSVKAVVTIGAPAEADHVLHNLTHALDEIAEKGVAEVNLGGRPVHIGQRFVEDVQSHDVLAATARLKRALLILHAPGDLVVGIENAANLFMAAKHPKSFVTLDDADHLLSDPSDADYAAGVIAAWAGRYMELAQPAPPIAVPEGVTRVSEADKGGYLQYIASGPHQLTADEPLAYGGTNRGPSPYQLLAASLGACTSMTVRMYARRKDWPLKHVAVEVTHDKVHAQDAGLGEKIDRFTRSVRLEGKLDAEQIARLMEIADKCPVHKTLERGAEIVTTRVAV